MADTADAAAAAAPPATDASGTPTVTAGVGIIYPPPELRNIVDKTAQFVAKPENGWDFVERIREEKKGEAKFNFLKANNPYHGYFLHRIDEFKDGVSLAAGTDAVEVEDGAVANARHAVEPMEAPPEPEFTINPPTIAAMDLDIVKLMAQFVARNGNHFLQKVRVAPRTRLWLEGSIAQWDTICRLAGCRCAATLLHLPPSAAQEAKTPIFFPHPIPTASSHRVAP